MAESNPGSNSTELTETSGVRSNVLLFCLVCAAVGFTLNLFPFELYQGLTLILGPAFSLLIAMSVGPVAGAVVAVVVSSALFFSWQHFWGFWLFVPEAYVVGILFRRGWNELLAVSCYWLVIAVPFVIGLYINNNSQLAVDVSLKYISNAFVYTLIASALIWLFSIPQKLNLEGRKSYSLRTQIFMILMVSMALPIAALLLYSTHQEMEASKQRVNFRLNSHAERIKVKVEKYLSENQFAIRKHAELLSFQPKKERYSNLRLREFQKQHDAFLSVFVASKKGEIESFSPLERLSEERPSVIDRTYFTEAISGKPYVSEVIRGRAKDNRPIIVLSQPVFSQDKSYVEDILAGSLDLSDLQQQFNIGNEYRDKRYREDGSPGRGLRKRIYFLVTDSEDKVIIASNKLKLETMQRLLWGETPSERNEGFYTNNYLNADFVAGSAILENGWKVRTIYFSEHFNRGARSAYHKLWIMLIAAILVIGVLAAFISNQINGSLLWLLKRANSLDLSDSPIKAPLKLSSHIPKEVRELVRAFESAERRIKMAYETEKMHYAKRIDAEKASVEKSLFVSSMSHELRTPLNAILGFCQLLREEGELPEEAKNLTDEIYIASQHLMLLINDILDMSKIESGKLQLNIESVELNAVLKESALMIDQQAKLRKIQVNFDESKLARSLVLADKLKLKQVLINLLSNAVKYNVTGGKVEIRIKEDSRDFLLLTISDTGLGIPEEKMKLLFMPFERLSQERGEIDGHGIGLAVSKKLIETMKGELAVESAEGKGSTFTLKIPISQEEENEQKSSRIAKSNDIKPCRILYVEDNDINALVMQKAMSRYPQIEFYREPDGTSGIKRIEKEAFDFILLDITLPDMLGYDILEYIQSKLPNQHQAVFAVSANALSEDIQRGLAAGFDEYITKPVKFDALFAAIKKRQ